MSKLYNKYVVQKNDGTEIDPKAQYFVLRIDTDPIARAALAAYAHLTDDKELGSALDKWLVEGAWSGDYSKPLFE